MRYLPNSPFYALIDPDDLLNAESSASRELKETKESQLLVEFVERQQDRSVLERLQVLFQETRQHKWLLLPTSDRNLAAFRDLNAENVETGIYVPTDELLYKCPYFHRTINFGAQLDLLRRLFILTGNPFVLCDVSAIRDVAHYLEMTAGLAVKITPIRNHPDFRDVEEQFALLKRD